jgi:hypothetical protein
MPVEYAGQGGPGYPEMSGGLGDGEPERGQHIVSQGLSGMGRVVHVAHDRRLMIILIIHKNRVFALEDEG